MDTKKILIFVLLILFSAVFSACSENSNDQISETFRDLNEENLSTAYFAGGCFWCIEAAFEKYDGVHEAVSGYMGGSFADPTYDEVSSGVTGHRETVKILYDPAIIDYNDLLEIFWRQIDPTDKYGSFVDRGDQYTSAIFYVDESQHRAALQSKSKKADSERYNEPVVTVIASATKFYKAEEYHQDYYLKSPASYHIYRLGSGRDQYRKSVWGKDKDYKVKKENEYEKPSLEELKARLTPIQYEVTQKDKTEPAFDNQYWDNTDEGIYVDIVSGEPLFSSTHKYKSGTGWPSFTQPISEDNIVKKVDYKLFIKRLEVRSKNADSHLGHVFEDGPEPTGLRYCINSAALRFVPKEEMKDAGYGEYLYLFE